GTCRSWVSRPVPPCRIYRAVRSCRFRRGSRVSIYCAESSSVDSLAVRVQNLEMKSLVFELFAGNRQVTQAVDDQPGNRGEIVGFHFLAQYQLDLADFGGFVPQI